MTIKYKDAEGDDITIRNTHDVREILASPTVRLIVQSADALLSSSLLHTDVPPKEDPVLRVDLEMAGVSEPFLTSTVRALTREGVTIHQLRQGEVSEEAMEKMQIGHGVRLLLRRLCAPNDVSNCSAFFFLA